MTQNSELDLKLEGLNDRSPFFWHIEEQHLTCHIGFHNFTQLKEYLLGLFPIIEHHNHHPEITFSYNILTVKIWTTESNQLTDKDFQLAEDFPIKESP